MKHISEIAKANATVAKHIQQHGPALGEHLESCQDCGNDFTTAERFQRLCPACDATDKAAHEQAHRSTFRRDEFSARRRAQATDLEIARGEVIGQTCFACEAAILEGEKVIVNRDYTGDQQRATMRVAHAVCPSPFDGAA